MDKVRNECVAIVLGLELKRKRGRKRWVKEWTAKRARYTHVTLLKEIEISNPDDFKNYFRMSPDIFDDLLGLVAP